MMSTAAEELCSQRDRSDGANSGFTREAVGRKWAERVGTNRNTLSSRQTTETVLRTSALKFPM